jgi:hypothetical protein
MDNKSPGAVFNLCKTSLFIFNELYVEVKKAYTKENSDDYELKQFGTLFNSLLNTIKILFKLSKGSENDTYFVNNLF